MPKPKKKQNAFHLSESAEWATPKEVVQAADDVLGGIDVDPATTAEINARHIFAKQIYTAETNGLAHNWPGRVFINAPGSCPCVVEKSTRAGKLLIRIGCGNIAKNSDGERVPDKTPVCGCRLVRKFWEHLIAQHIAGITSAAIWIGFSLEQLGQLQAFDPHPLCFPVCIPPTRTRYLDPTQGFEPKGSPTHGSFYCYLGPRPDLFRSRFSELGAIV